jgi:hypothetical protein
MTAQDQEHASTGCLAGTGVSNSVACRNRCGTEDFCLVTAADVPLSIERLYGLICIAPTISGTNSAVRIAFRPIARLAQQPVYSPSLKARAVAIP